MSTWDGGSKVPFIARWPGKIPAGKTSDQLLSTMDLFPTFAELAGATLPEHSMDGLNAADFLLDKKPDSPRDEYLYYAATRLTGVRDSRWKLELPRPSNPPGTGWWGRMLEAVDPVQLYDLRSDPGETTDLAGKHPEVVASLMERVGPARAKLGNFDRIGSGARFFDDGPKRPDRVKTSWQGKGTGSPP